MVDSSFWERTKPKLQKSWACFVFSPSPPLKEVREAQLITYQNPNRSSYFHTNKSLPVCKGTVMCSLQSIFTTTLPPFSSSLTIGPSKDSFSIRSLTSCNRRISHFTAPEGRLWVFVKAPAARCCHLLLSKQGCSSSYWNILTNVLE